MLLDLPLLSQTISIFSSSVWVFISSMSDSKCAKLLCCPGVDRISQLPDDIIDNILIRLSTADAARTAVLSRKWKHGWINISKVKFDYEFVSRLKEVDRQQLITIIYGILMLHLGPIIGFKLSITLPDNTTSDIDRIFHFLSRKDVQELDVFIIRKRNGYSGFPGPYVLPSHFFSCLQLRCLEIAGCNMNLPCNFGGFRNLIRLDLKHLELANSVFGNFFSKCPLIEELIISWCNFTESSVVKINAPNLKRVQFNCHEACLCFTSAPLLKSLTHRNSKYFYRGTVIFGKRCFDFEGAENSSLDDFCIAMPALESLVVDYCFLQSLEVRKCGSHPKWLHSLKSLEARDVCLLKMDEVTSLLGLISSSPNLKQLLIKVKPYYCVDGMENPFRSLESNHLDFPPCEKLEVVSLQGIKDRDLGVDLVKLLLLKSPNLKTMFIQTLEGETVDKRLEILTKVSRFRRASTAAEIDFGLPRVVNHFG